jgi:cysteinyl-tRNA synthetase
MRKSHDTSTHSKRDFIPIDASDIKMYVCGPTVYDLAHLGNARSAVVFDQMRRILEFLYPKVTFVRNVTDIDDKIIDRVRETGEDMSSLTERNHATYLHDMSTLGVRVPTLELKATHHIPHMQRMITTLIQKGHAYEASGHVLFDIHSNPHAGELSGHDMTALRAGARVEKAPYKRDQADFVLWKPSIDDQPGWESPWGFGRPGWHIECSAMSAEHLGKTFDIHGGGQDLVFPHHENEHAQSTCAHGNDRMANYWAHNGMLTVNGEKMSKSKGNFITVHEILNKYPDKGEALRFILLSSHYRQSLDFTRTKMEEAIQILDRFYLALQSADSPLPSHIDSRVINPLLDDLNMPLAIAGLHELTAEVFTANGEERIQLAASLKASGMLLGLLSLTPTQWLQGFSLSKDIEIEHLIAERERLRKARNFQEADTLRLQLTTMGVILEDGKNGTSWRRL